MTKGTKIALISFIVGIIVYPWIVMLMIWIIYGNTLPILVGITVSYAISIFISLIPGVIISFESMARVYKGKLALSDLTIKKLEKLELMEKKITK